MRDMTTTSPARWLLLICIGLGCLLGQAGMVICRDDGGAARLEWGCEQVEGSGCTPAGQPSDPRGDDPQPSPAPCEDTPVQPGQSQAHSASRPIDIPHILPPIVMAVLDPPWFSTPPAACARGADRPARPPDMTARLRSVILIV
ncbi:MAG: hypothetical protein IT436_11485 [Phycisphaerales bacterium]|nr:hypothetical protein [Phycisphaerales bacterium]